MKKVRKCPTCKVGEQKSVVLLEHNTTLSYNNIEYPISVLCLPMIQCSEKCGWRLYPDGSFDLLVDELRVQADIITPKRIIVLREAMGMTQEEFAKYADIAVATLDRYERGGQIPFTIVNERFKALEKEHVRWT